MIHRVYTGIVNTLLDAGTDREVSCSDTVARRWNMPSAAPARHGASINNAASGMLLLPLSESLTARETRNLG